jgi:excisionase family DNA binding protein
MKNQITRRTMSIPAVADELGISKASAYQYARNGQLPVIKLGKRFLVIKDKFEEMFQQKKRV